MKGIVLVGAPGCGKGTQAKKLVAEFGWAHLSAGDLIRDEIAEQTELGRQIKSTVESGRLIPDEVISSLIDYRLGKADCARGFILDGYPRTLGQARDLDRLLTAKDNQLVAAVYFTVSLPVVLVRLGGRLSCPKCGAVYHVKNQPPKTAGLCDACGSKLVSRADDTPEIISQRFEVFNQQTLPLVQYYRDQKKLVTVNGEDPPDKVLGEIKDFLASYQ